MADKITMAAFLLMVVLAAFFAAVYVISGPSPAPFVCNEEPADSARSVPGVETHSMQLPSLAACLQLIQKTATELAVAPVNIVETTAMRMVRFPTRDGSVLLTCMKDGSATVTKSPHKCGVTVKC